MRTSDAVLAVWFVAVGTIGPPYLGVEVLEPAPGWVDFKLIVLSQFCGYFSVVTVFDFRGLK